MLYKYDLFCFLLWGRILHEKISLAGRRFFWIGYGGYISISHQTLDASATSRKKKNPKLQNKFLRTYSVRFWIENIIVVRKYQDSQ